MTGGASHVVSLSRLSQSTRAVQISLGSCTSPDRPLNDIRCPTLSPVIALYSYYRLSRIIKYRLVGSVRSPVGRSHSVSDHQESFTAKVTVGEAAECSLLLS